ncbi:TetR/AcrR family transcriptional regulator [Yinghuangia seranimata]|uniref:TetR/AcrR family transcriptional regulator n=1 Tax=Yinghuangia seranimata TaxID=408067 RepID=UPI00248C926A|nr:TetR/AcrR family transcriptional regulator [Yinghuangia seranimata]MDI2129408.1 TetR/AcrR family transcriptional regulator [Yinghuangia seranimata]
MTQETGGARGRGRPARLSRDQIIDGAVALVYDDPATPLTIKRVSEAVNSAPMALYRYFPDRDDLLHAVADRVAADMRFDKPAGATWQEQLREWMLLSLEHLRPYPQLLPYIASTRKPAWLPSFVLLTEILQPLGLSDEDTALAVTLVGTTIVGHATLAAQRAPVDEMLPTLREALRAEEPDARERVGPVLDQLPNAFARLYDVVIDNTITAIEALGGKAPARGRHPKSPGRKTPLAPIFTNAAPL